MNMKLKEVITWKILGPGALKFQLKHTVSKRHCSRTIFLFIWSFTIQTMQPISVLQNLGIIEEEGAVLKSQESESKYLVPIQSGWSC